MEAVTFGRPANEALLEEIKNYDANRVFLLASGTLSRNTDEIDKIRRSLGNKCVGEFFEMSPHTPRKDVIAATKLAMEKKADLIVTFGGGSLTDAAKAIALCISNNITDVRKMDELRNGNSVDGGTLNGPSIPQITIPTTLSGGEFSAISGVTDESSKTKELFRHPGIMPKVVILDPAPTIHTPEWLFLSTGIRAVDHCVEGICSMHSHPYGDAQAIQGLSLLSSGLVSVKNNPSDLEARLNCQLGTWMSMAPLASGVPMGASHGIGYVLGAAFDIPHGHTSCIMLPAVMRWNEKANYSRQVRVSQAMGSPETSASQLLEKLIQDLGMPTRLSDVDINAKDFASIAEKAMGTPWVPHNPRKINCPSDVLEILKLAE
jgi:maleylacetate reductase